MALLEGFTFLPYKFMSKCVSIKALMKVYVGPLTSTYMVGVGYVGMWCVCGVCLCLCMCIVCVGKFVCMCVCVLCGVCLYVYERVVGVSLCVCVCV